MEQLNLFYTGVVYADRQPQTFYFHSTWDLGNTTIIQYHGEIDNDTISKEAIEGALETIIKNDII